MNKAPTSMLRIYEFSKAGIVHVLNNAPILSAELENEVEHLWQLEQQRLGRTLFNGEILSATLFGSDYIECNIVEYRRFIAQQLRPDLFNELFVQPVAVSGLLCCKEGIVFGRRSSFVTQDPNLWELVPSGGLDIQHRKEDCVDFLAQVFIELSEEVGITASEVTQAFPLCIIQDEKSKVVDIGICLVAPNLLATTILAAHDHNMSKEYSELKVVPYAEITDFTTKINSELSPVSLMLLNVYQTWVWAQKNTIPMDKK